MKSLCKFYVVDSLTESVVGSFFANNARVAEKIVQESIKSNEKVKMIGEHLKVYADKIPFTEYETYDEILDSCSVLKFEDNAG